MLSIELLCTKHFKFPNPILECLDMDGICALCRATQGNIGQSRTLVESVPQNPHVERDSGAVFIELV